MKIRFGHRVRKKDLEPSLHLDMYMNVYLPIHRVVAIAEPYIKGVTDKIEKTAQDITADMVANIIKKRAARIAK